MLRSDGVVSTKYWHRLDDSVIQCDMCPRFCRLREGQRGMCFIRANQAGEIVLTSYGRSSGFCVDPIEKKPLNHFLPGSAVLSFGTAGCNLACKFCQNWDISKSRRMDTLMDEALPDTIARAAAKLGCLSVAFTYNDPVVFHEYAIDVAEVCRANGIKTVAVSAGYVCPKPRAEFYSHMDAANVDLKAFSERFYRDICAGHIEPVLETLRYIHHETSVWLEITTLIIPGLNDSDKEIEGLTGGVANELGEDVPIHFSAFHPDWKMMDLTSTTIETLRRARDIAMGNGLHYVYTGNADDETTSSTYCVRCKKRLIGRDWYVITEWNLSDDGRCQFCNELCAGVFNGPAGTWGSKRLPIRLSDFEHVDN